MTRNFSLAILGAVCAIGLSACSETANEGASMQPSEAMRTGSAQDEQACLSAVEAQADNSVTVLSSEFSEANTLVMVGVGPQQAPWRCLVSKGRVAEVMSMTNEGTL